MDIREIQTLHAQYTAQPVIIDIASHTAAMPALPAPHRTGGLGATVHTVAANLHKAGKPALIALAIAVVAAGGGMSIARIWHAMHETVAVKKVAAPAAVKEQPSSQPRGPDAEMPLNAAPPRPLTSGDLDTHRPAVQSAFANVDARSLPTTAPATASARPAQATPLAPDNHAAASPIREQRPATQAVPTTPAAPVAMPAHAAASTPSAPESAASVQQARPSTTTASASVTQPKPEPTPPEAPKTEARPALRPLHHITRRPATNSETSQEQAAPVQPKAAPVKSGDVQLF